MEQDPEITLSSNIYTQKKKMTKKKNHQLNRTSPETTSHEHMHEIEIEIETDNYNIICTLSMLSIRT